MKNPWLQLLFALFTLTGLIVIGTLVMTAAVIAFVYHPGVSMAIIGMGALAGIWQATRIT